MSKAGAISLDAMGTTSRPTGPEQDGVRDSGFHPVTKAFIKDSSTESPIYFHIRVEMSIM